MTKILSLFLLVVSFIFSRPAFAATPISYGQIVDGSISVAGEQDEYIFSGAQDDVVTIFVASTSGNLIPRLGSSQSSYIFDYKLTEAGDYTFLVSDKNSTGVGSYQVSLYRMNSPLNATTINFGQTASGNLNSPVEIKAHTFTANTNDRVCAFLSTPAEKDQTSNPYIILQDAEGNYLGQSNFAVNLVKTIPSAGTFHLFVLTFLNTYSATDYKLTLNRLQTPTGYTSINFGESIVDETTLFDEVKVYRFSGSANDKVCIGITAFSNNSGAFLPLIEIYDSLMNLLPLSLDSESHYHYLATLPYSGDFYIFVRDYYHNGTGAYELTLQRPNNPANIKSLSYSSIVEDSLEFFSGMNVYSFNAGTNDSITISVATKMGEPSALNCYLELYDTSGVSLAKSSTGCLKHTFSNAGTFYLFISDKNLDAKGIYRFILSQGDISCSANDLVAPYVALSNPYMGEIIESGSTYQISWVSSDNVSIVSQEISLSRDGGLTYPIIIASALDGGIQSYNWLVPQNSLTTKGRMKITARDAQGNQGQDTSAKNFMILDNTTLPVDSLEVYYEYDTLNQLIESISPDIFTFNYTYDDLGNRLTLYTTVNRPPELSFIGNKTVAESQLLEFTVSAIDVDGDTLVFSAVNLPPGATFNPDTKVFSWRPNYNQAGVYLGIHFEVTDGKVIDSEDITIVVNETNQPPELGPIGNKTVQEGQLLEFMISASDPDGDELGYSVENLPAGAYFSADQRIFSWLPGYNQEGIYTVRFTVTDSELAADFEDVLITVNDAQGGPVSAPSVGITVKVRVVP